MLRVGDVPLDDEVGNDTGCLVRGEESAQFRVLDVMNVESLIVRVEVNAVTIKIEQACGDTGDCANLLDAAGGAVVVLVRGEVLVLMKPSNDGF